MMRYIPPNHGNLPRTHLLGFWCGIRDKTLALEERGSHPVGCSLDSALVLPGAVSPDAIPSSLSRAPGRLGGTCGHVQIAVCRCSWHRWPDPETRPLRPLGSHFPGRSWKARGVDIGKLTPRYAVMWIALLGHLD